ncbi:hypothetical protein H257_19021 [Aphanomyces astaci]|uniref:Guanylate cyclase domain-containing protein n=1 Tax=Aphanomyces astaci TaxID=112090 RepID=W4F9A3_APHAT|nr:hypothetical protein H257_19021 [Aphanomyces astaci]ETV64037.1 hypothetical protein H257_19021 [Aphanomyces astaci]|eukprot:XP_009846479.1 hypothetical protein H257_19021 [Aphanomyces astaci]
MSPAISYLDEESYPFPVWSFLYAIVLGVACVASVAATWTLRKYSKLVSSCVCSAMLHFFIWKSIYTLFRIAVVSAVIHQYLCKTSTWFILDEDHDVGGFRFIGREVGTGSSPGLCEPPYYVKICLFIGDASLISGAYWMLILVVELLRLVKTTVDRGAHQEKVFVRFYMYINLMMLVSYVAASFYASRFRSFLVTSSVAQSVVIIAVSSAVLYLNCTRQKLESVECRIVQKPLYIRLKLILLIYDLTALPYFGVGWTLAVMPMSLQQSLDFVPNWILITSNLFYFMSPIALAFLLVANQQCMMSWCMVPEDVIKQIQANEPPKHFPVFVNTDIESSSALWGALGSVMHDAQDIHDNLLRSLLVPHHGYEITTAGDSFQLAFHNIADAVAYCLDVQQKLLQQEWPRAFVDCHMPGSATITTHQSFLKRPKMVFHGVRVRMGIHASNPSEGDLVNQVHPVTGRMMYVGLSELIGREVSDIGCGGQIIVTAPIVRWLRANVMNATPWAKAHPMVWHELGVYHIEDLKINLGIAQVVPMSLQERVRLFPLPKNVQSCHFRVPGSNYSLLISPRSQSNHRAHEVEMVDYRNDCGC